MMDAGAASLAEALHRLAARPSTGSHSHSHSHSNPHSNPPLAELACDGNVLTDVGAAHLARLLPLPGFRSLSMGANLVSAAGAGALAQSLARCAGGGAGVRELRLEGCMLGDAGAELLAEGLRTNARCGNPAYHSENAASAPVSPLAVRLRLRPQSQVLFSPAGSGKQPRAARPGPQFHRPAGLLGARRRAGRQLHAAAPGAGPEQAGGGAPRPGAFSFAAIEWMPRASFQRPPDADARRPFPPNPHRRPSGNTWPRMRRWLPRERGPAPEPTRIRTPRARPRRVRMRFGIRMLPISSLIPRAAPLPCSACAHCGRSASAGPGYWRPYTVTPRGQFRPLPTC